MTTSYLMEGYVLRREYDDWLRAFRACRREMHRARTSDHFSKWVWMANHLRARGLTSRMKTVKTQLQTRRIQAAA